MFGLELPFTYLENTIENEKFKENEWYVTYKKYEEIVSQEKKYDKYKKLINNQTDYIPFMYDLILIKIDCAVRAETYIYGSADIFIWRVY
jgi:hypothetical protein